MSASILVVLWLLRGAVWRGDIGAAPFLLIWLGFAGLGLYAGLRRLQALTGLAPPAAPPRPPGRRAGTTECRSAAMAEAGEPGRMAFRGVARSAPT